MGKTLYLSCDSGISADMVVGALLDLGGNQEKLECALASLPLDGYQVKISKKTVSSIPATDFDVVLDHEHESHDHDMAWLYGDLDQKKPEHHHHHGHEEEGHHHGHDGEGHRHHHEHRNLADIMKIIDAGELSPRANELAKKIFRIVAEAESRAHGVSVDEVHFHEVGAVDSIVDTVAAAVLVDDLDITDTIVGPLAEGSGRIRTQHGVLSIPVPAVTNIAMAHGLVLAPNHREGEFVTPTGAAIAAALKTRDELPAAYTIEASGIGTGKRAYKPISTVRALLIVPRTAPGTGTEKDACGGMKPLWKLESEIDDATGETLGYALDHLYAAGVLEAHYVPIYMKKNRPAWQIQVLCTEEQRAEVERILFEDTTTIGIRRSQMNRTTLPRRESAVETELGEIAVKVVTLPDGHERAYPEYDAVAQVARQRNLPFQAVMRTVLKSLEA